PIGAVHVSNLWWEADNFPYSDRARLARENNCRKFRSFRRIAPSNISRHWRSRGFFMHRIRHKRSSQWTLWLGFASAVAVMAGFLQYSSILAEKKKSGTYNYLKSVPSDSALRGQLKDEEYRVTRLNETETAFRNKYWN